MPDPIFVLVGATASGKSSAALHVAEALDAEIVSLDSMSVYRGMDIGTDKPSPKDRDRVPHHLVDVLDPEESFDLRRYLAEADAALEDIAGRGRRALVAGGTGLYLMGLWKGIFEGPQPDPELRARLEALPTDELRHRLAAVDPEALDRIHENDRRRTRRALEVFEQTGRTLSEQQEQFEGLPRHDARFAGIRRSREDLYARIRARVDDMFAGGLIDEVRGLALGPTAAQGVGYKEVRAALDGAYDLEEARTRVVRHTIRLVRRQSTWFKRFPVTWVDAAPEDGPETLAPKLVVALAG